MVTAARTLVSAAKIPVDAAACVSERRTFPLWLPTNTRPPTTVGCASGSQVARKAERPFELQTRHLSGGESGRARRPDSRVLKVLTAQPFHAGPASGPAKCTGSSGAHRLRQWLGHQGSSERFSGDEFRDGAALHGRASCGHRDHRRRSRARREPVPATSSAAPHDLGRARHRCRGTWRRSARREWLRPPAKERGCESKRQREAAGRTAGSLRSVLLRLQRAKAKRQSTTKRRLSHPKVYFVRTRCRHEPSMSSKS